MEVLSKKDLKFQAVIRNGITFLLKAQLKNGNFISLSSKSQKDFSNAKKLNSIFPTILVLSCLSEIDGATVKKIKERIAGFLLSQKSEFWSFNYWDRSSKEAKKMPYPDDLDDTFCALSALFLYDSSLINGKAMAKIVAVLTAVEKKEGGPYKTWLVPKEANKVWEDVDLVVNSNIAYFLSSQEIDLPNIVKFIEKAINAQKYESQYYPSIYPIVYFISRFYRGKKQKKIIEFLLPKQEKNGKWENPLNIALVVSALLNLGVESKKMEHAVGYLIKSQKNGCWPAYAFCLDPAIKGEKYYAGSSELTTAFCLEAINKYANKRRDAVLLRLMKQDVTIRDEAMPHLYNKIIIKIEKDFSLLGDEFKSEALKFIEKIIKIDKDKQIVLLPYFFKKSLGKNGEKISDKLLVDLGLANLYGWIAYTIYDDFLDDEGQPELLSVANFSLRQLTDIFNNLKVQGIKKEFFEIMNVIDSANVWEIANCRIKKETFKMPNYKNYSKLYEKSLGHALGPIAILLSLGHDPNSQEASLIKSFFKHYLIARQMNDDAHDWEEDLKKGHINSAGDLILKKAKQKKIKFNMEMDCAPFQEIFWYDVSVDICDKILNNVKLAKENLQKISIIEKPEFLEKLLAPVENSAKKALKERKKTIDFLGSYKA